MTTLWRGWPALVLVLALATRLWGIDWQAPATLYFDELKYVERAGATVRGQPLEVADFRNPTLFRHLLEAEYRLAALVHPIDDVRQASNVQLALARVTSAVLGAAACLLTALAAARLARGRCRTASGALVGLSAGLMLAVAPLQVHLSHYALNDAPASFVMAAGLLFGVRALTGGDWRDFLLAGLLAGLAAATKYNFGVVLALPLVATLDVRGDRSQEKLDVGSPSPSQWGGRRGVGPPQGWRLLPTRLLGLVLGGFLVGLVLGMPEVVTSPVEILAGIAEQARLGAIRWNGQSDAPIYQLYGETLIRGLGWPVLLLAVCGAITLGRRDQFLLAGLLSVPVACLAIMLRQELFFARFALPLLPPVAILGGLGVGGLAEVASRRLGEGKGKALALGVLLIALVPGGRFTLRHDQLATTTDTRLLAQGWLERRAGGAKVATEVYGLPLNWSGGTGVRGYRLQRVAALVDPASVKRLACDGTRYFVTASLTSEREVARRRPTAEGTGYDLLAQAGRVAAIFDPFWPGLSAPAHPDDTGIPFWYLDAYERPGPRITIFEVPEGAIPCP